MIILDYQNPEKQLKVFAKVLGQAKVKLRWSRSLACQICEVRVASGHKLTKKAHGRFKRLGKVFCQVKILPHGIGSYFSPSNIKVYIVIGFFQKLYDNAP